MKRTFYRSLDRGMSLFGLKGEWIKIFLISLGAGLTLALMFGAVAGISVGIATFFAVGVIGFFGCLVFQSRIPPRRINKVRVAGKMKLVIRRRELLSRIIFSDPNYETTKAESKASE